MSYILKKIVLCSVLAMTAILNAFAQMVINVSGAQQQARPIAIAPINGDSGVGMDYIIASDLHKTGLFKPIAPDKFPPLPRAPNEINYAKWQQIGADYLLLGRIVATNSLQLALSEVNSAKIVGNEQVKASDPRQVAHAASDKILQWLTGQKGAFATKLAYVFEADTKGAKRHYALIISDIDGANRREIYSSDQPILSPAWSPDGRSIAFVTFANRRAQIVIQSLTNGTRRVVVEGDGISSAPAFSHDGRKLAFAQSKMGNLDIYLMNLANGATQRLTQHAAIDTEPSFAPDDNSIYFTSDRGGTAQIYRMGLGGDAQRVVVGNSYSANGQLSPDGKTIVLTRQSGGAFQIGLYHLQNGRFESLTSGRLDEGASFSPDGRMIIYATRENGRSVLKIINRFGGLAQTLSDPNGRLRDPDWGPDLRGQ